MPTRAASVRTVLGVLLLVAAGLKLFALSGAGASVAAVPELGWFAQPWVQLLVAEWELLLGAWLLSGVSARMSWLAALVTFGAFAAVSGYFGWVGVASCGCLGAVQTNPWWMFGADVTAVALLAVSRPKAEPRTTTPFERALATSLCGMFVSTLVLVLLASIFYPSLAVALAAVRGEEIVISPNQLSFGDCRSGETHREQFVVTNLSDQRRTILGHKLDCNCAIIDDFPFVLEPGESRTVLVSLNVPEVSPGRITTVGTVWTDAPNRSRLPIRLHYVVQP